MRHFSKIYAQVMAMALSFFIAAPLSANAQVIITYDKDSSGKTVRTYTNEDTNQSISEKDGYISENNNFERIIQSELRAITINTKSYNETCSFTTALDTAKLTNFRSNKKALKVSVLSKNEYTDPEKKFYNYEYKDKDGNFYYRDVNGSIVKFTNGDKPDTVRGEDRGNYTIRFFTKKAGKYKFSYDAILKNGSTVTKTVDIIAKEYKNPITRATFAGKDIYVGTGNEKYSDNVLDTKGISGDNATTKSSGKLKIVMNKGFKLKKIEVGTPLLTTTEDDGIKIIDYAEAHSSLDYAYTDITCSWVTVKNGKKIKLGTVDVAGRGSYPKNHDIFSKGLTTPTYIRVTYFDTNDKTTKRTIIEINKVQK